MIVLMEVTMFKVAPTMGTRVGGEKEMRRRQHVNRATAALGNWIGTNLLKCEANCCVDVSLFRS